MSSLSRLSASLAFGTAMLASVAAGATTFQTLYNFANGPNGKAPVGELIVGKAAALLYGTTSAGGAGGAGIVFSLDPVAKTMTVLHNFTDLADGGSPFAAMTTYQAGFVGSTALGGGSGVGTLFTLDPITPALTTVHSFTNGPDGAGPNDGLSIDKKNTLYGTTQAGALGFGTLYKCLPSKGTFTTLHTFLGGTDGQRPNGGVALTINPATHAVTALYGTTYFGGTSGNGMVFKFDPVLLRLAVLHNFTSATDGANPQTKLVFDANGVLYGTTQTGGVGGYGTVFSIDTMGTNFTVLHTFTNGADGANPQGQLVFNKHGDLFGTTFAGGAGGSGTVFKLVPTTKVLTTLHAFTGTDGANPQAGVVLGPKGLIYGVTRLGGTNNLGTVYMITP